MKLVRILLTLTAIVPAPALCDSGPTEADLKSCVMMHQNDSTAGIACAGERTIVGVRKTDAKVEGGKATILAEVDFLIKIRMGMTSDVSRSCVGGNWVFNPDLNNKNYANPGQHVLVDMRFDFEKFQSG